MAMVPSEGQKLFDFIRKMASLTLAVQDLSAVFGLAVMTSEAIIKGSRAKVGPFRIVRIPRLRIGGDMAPRYNDGIALDRTIVHDARVAGGAALRLPAQAERLHMLPMAHDQSHVFHRLREVPRRNFRSAKDVLMTPETDL